MATFQRVKSDQGRATCARPSEWKVNRLFDFRLQHAYLAHFDAKADSCVKS